MLNDIYPVKTENKKSLKLSYCGEKQKTELWPRSKGPNRSEETLGDKWLIPDYIFQHPLFRGVPYVLQNWILGCGKKKNTPELVLWISVHETTWRLSSSKYLQFTRPAWLFLLFKSSPTEEVKLLFERLKQLYSLTNFQTHCIVPVSWNIPCPYIRPLLPSDNASNDRNGDKSLNDACSVQIYKCKEKAKDMMKSYYILIWVFPSWQYFTSLQSSAHVSRVIFKWIIWYEDITSKILPF